VNQVGRSKLFYTTTPLMAAAKNEHFNVVQYLVQECEADPNIADSDGRNAMHYAACFNKKNTDVIQLLLDQMSIDSINQNNGFGSTPLDYAYNCSITPIKEDKISLIRSYGGKANEHDTNGNNVEKGNGDLHDLVRACEKGSLDDVKVLLEAHDVNYVGTSRNGYDRTALMVSAEKGHTSIVRHLLLNAKADPNIQNSGGWNALHFASRNNKKTTDIVKSLLQHISIDSINQKTTGESTPLDMAHTFNRSPMKQGIIRLIRSYGGKANKYDTNGNLVGEGNGEL
jgi:ankyrin repeat protein